MSHADITITKNVSLNKTSNYYYYYYYYYYQ